MKLIYLPLLILTGCCTTDTKIGIPPRPELTPVPGFDVALDHEPPLAVRLYLEEHDDLVLIQHDNLWKPIEVCAENDLSVKEYAAKLESRIKLHDEAH